MPDPHEPLTTSPELVAERQDVRRWLLADILRGEFKNKDDRVPTENDPASEETVVARYDGLNSRMPVRMALAVLAAEGIVRQRARHGFWIAEVDQRVVEQIGQLRAGTEAMVAGVLHDAISGRSTDGTRLYLMKGVHESADDMRRIAGASHDSPGFAAEPVARASEAEFGDMDTAFHWGLALAAGYDIAARHIVEWRNQMRLFRVQHGIRYTVQALQHICDEHDHLLDSLNGGPDDPRDWARRHIDLAVRRSLPDTLVNESPAEQAASAEVASV